MKRLIDRSKLGTILSRCFIYKIAYYTNYIMHANDGGYFKFIKFEMLARATISKQKPTRRTKLMMKQNVQQANRQL